MKKQVIVDLEALNEITLYMANRPYKEVVRLLNNLKDSVREISNEKEETEKKD